MSNNRNLGNIATAITNATSGQVLTSQGNGVATFADAAGGSSVTTVTNVSGASDSLTAISSPSVGDIVFVTSTNGLFIRKSNGWFKIADVTNLQPTNLTGVSDSALAIDGTATTITLAATDPEGLVLTFSAAAKTGSNTTFSAALTDGNTVNALNGSTVIATVAQASNVFTITPNTASNDGTVDITFSVTDGINTALTDDGQFTLTFVTIVTDSNHTTLLATATGTSDNNNITDSSSNNRSITVNGDAHAGTFSPYRSGGYSTYFDGSNDYLKTPSSDFYLSTGQFSVEVWIKPSDLSGNKLIFMDSNYNLYTYNTQVKWWSNSVYTGNAGTALLSVGKWTHLLVTRDSNNTLRIFADGVLLQVVTNHTHDYGTSNTAFELSYSGGNKFAGEMRDARVISGSIPSDYQTSSTTTTSASAVITVPTEPLTAVSGTKLLACNQPYLVYTTASATGYFNTIGGNPSTKPFSPYDYDEYSATDHGGSVYFGGGTREHLSTSLPAFGTQDFEVEFWIYGGALTSATWYTLFSRDYNVNGSFRIYASGNASSGADKFIYIANGTQYNYTSAGKIKDNVWNHILLSRVSGTAKWFINGIEDTSWSDSENMTSTATLYIGDTGADETLSGSYPFVGYMSDIAIRMGGSGYRTSTFTPPTTPLSSTGAELHIKGTDASIIDKSQSSNLKLFGNTTGSTTQAKFSNTKSMYFGGETSGDYIQVMSTDEQFNLGKDPFTIEAWVFPDGAIGNNTVLSGGQHSTNRFDITGLQSTGLRFFVSSTVSCDEDFTEPSANVWSHIAFVRNGTSLSFYINGTLDRTATISADLSLDMLSYYLLIGERGHLQNLAISDCWDGYIQDLRITKGLARYTANFTPPSAPLEG